MTSSTRVLSRRRVAIDDHSYIESFGSSAQTALIFIHGVLGKHKETWDATPLALVSTSVLADADYGSFGYNTTFVDFRDASGVAAQFTLWMRTHLRQYQRVFIVAHSMGGLVIRDALGRLVRTGTSDDQALFSKVRHCFLIAVPLSGSWLARCLRVFAAPFNRKLGYLARPQDYFRYSATVSRATALGIPRPKFSIFVGTEDAQVQEPASRATTRDDTFEGFVPGTHSSVKKDLNVNSTLLQRMVQIINDYQVGDSRTQLERLKLESALGTSTEARRPEGTLRGTARPRSGALDARDVVLLSCSASKRTDGERQHPRDFVVRDVLASAEVGVLALQTRIKMMTLIQQGRIDGTEFHEGNRAARPQNKELILGPDFGGALNATKYLPAYLRYTGRSYQATPAQWDAFLQRSEAERPDVLIMSGLYGLVPMTELIQNYDCHITDTDTQTGLLVRNYWGDIMTDVLISHLDWLERGGWTVGRIFDLLSERSYQRAIDWVRVYPRWKVLHRVFENNAGRDSLANNGVWVQKTITDPGRLTSFGPDTFFEDADFHGGDRIAFEERLGESRLSVAREP
jgi:pimeloyl-ACP methyl ester carboxylesterase